MRGAGAQHRRTTGRPWPALLVALSILLQGLIPAAAIAGDHGGGLVQICTQAGLRTRAEPGHHHFGGLACEQCVMASFAAMAAAAPTFAAPRTMAIAEAPRTVARIAHRTRAPPRPPSQGPPTFA